MKILAIDTSSKRCSVCISENNNNLINLFNDDEKTHSVKLMPMISKAFSKTNLTLDDISLLVCCIGPGSFTGVRIGISTIKAFSDAKNIPVVGVNSLESLAYNVKNLVKKDSLVCSLIDAKNSNVYCGIYDFSNDNCKQIFLKADNIQEIINDLNTFSNKYNNFIFVGDGSTVYEDNLRKSFGAKAIFADEQNININNIFEYKESSLYSNLQNGYSLTLAGINKYEQKEYGNSNSIHPLYLRKSQAERELEKNIVISRMTTEDLISLSTNFETDFNNIWNIDILKDDFSQNNSIYFVAKIKDEIVGFAGMKKICDEAQIMNIVTKINKRHLGIGSKLLDYLIKECISQNIKFINLEVNSNNIYAINLYEKFNFKRIGLRKKYYNNTDDAILMSLEN